MRYAEVRYGFAPSTLNSPASRVFAIRNDTGELSVKVGFTPPPMAERSIVTSVSVCLCVFVLDHIFGTTRPSFTDFFVHVTYGRGSVLFWHRSDKLCTSGFLDDVMSAHKSRLLDVAAQLKRSAHAALGLAMNCAQ